MNTKTKVLLDRTVATPIANVVNLAARAAGRVLKRDHSVDVAQVRTIVVAKLVGMGSIIQAVPLLRALKRHFPHARLVFLTTTANQALVERLAPIDEVIALRGDSAGRLALDSAQAVAALARREVDLYLDLEVYSAAASLLSAACLARNRYGFYRHSARFKIGLHTHLVFLNIRAPISELYLQLYRVISGEPAGSLPDGDDFGPIRVDPADVEGVRRFFERTGAPFDAPYVVINPNASDLLLERRWPLESFAQVIERLAERGERVVLTGAPSERAYVDGLVSVLGPRARASVLNSAGELTLTQLFALIQSASAVVTNDTGPMHIAIAFRRPLVCMFGPGAPDHYGVKRENVAILYRRLICSPCIYETDDPPCAGNNVCMRLITPDEVFAALDRVRDRRTSSAAEVSGPSLWVTGPRGEQLGVLTRASASSLASRRQPS